MFRTAFRKLNYLKFKKCCRFCCTEVNLKNANSEFHSRKNHFDSYDDYFTNSLNRDRYKAFCKKSSIFYQIDDETHNIVEWKKPLSYNSKMVEWNNLPENYTNDQLIGAFEDMLDYSVANNKKLSDPIFDYFIDEFTENVEQFTINQLLWAIQAFAKLQLDKQLMLQQNYIELYIAFDQAFTIKSSNLLPDQAIFLSSLWKCLPIAKKTFFSSLLGRLLNRYLRHMNAQQLSQSMNFLNNLSKPIENIPAFENFFYANLDDMNLQELAIVLWTFNRTDMKIQKTELRNKLYEYVHKQDLSQLDDRFLIQILNVIIFFFIIILLYFQN